MSTKVYTAHKLKRATYLWPLVRDIRLKATENVRTALRGMYSSLTPDVNTDTEVFKKAVGRYSGLNRTSEQVDYLARIHIVQKILNRAYRINSTKLSRSPFNFDVSVGFRQYEGGIYVIPYCDCTMRTVLDFLEDDNRLRDYHYQNSTDRPEEIPAREWRKRRAVWHGMDKSGQWKDVLVLDICKYDMYWELDPIFSLYREKFNLANSEEPPQ